MVGGGGGGCRGQRPILLLLQMLAGALQELLNKYYILEGVFNKFMDIFSLFAVS